MIFKQKSLYSVTRHRSTFDTGLLDAIKEAFSCDSTKQFWCFMVRSRTPDFTI